ncbi:unknown [Firmicutes bacterium CAG:822]|nr:unknown [Firmicutes bacterium CAG:822]
MDSKEKKKINVKIILSLIALLIIVIALFIAFSQRAEEESGPVDHNIVEGLYEDHADEKCTEVINIKENSDINNVDDKILLHLIFGQMKKDKVLTDTISMDDYRTSALKIMDEEYIPTNVNYIFEGYKYTLDGEGIKRSKANCEENYVSKLYGYSGVNDLEVDVMAGYVKDGKVYDLNGKEIGTYAEEEINDILDNGTMQVYNYKKVNDNYKLVSVGVK